MPTMTHSLIAKLECFGPLPREDRELIVALTRTARTWKPRSKIIDEGDTPNDVNLIVDGFAYRYKQLDNGDRQILAYLIPGDFCDLHVSLLGMMDHSIAALTQASVVQLSRQDIAGLLDRPAISRAMLMATLVDEATLRAWLTNMGQRSAEKRVAHFFCEWHRRLRAVGLASDDGCELPLTQEEIADTMGLSTVHVNRSLQTLRQKGLLSVREGRLGVPEMRRLCESCDFEPNYLHITHQCDGRPQGRPSRRKSSPRA